MKNKLGLLLATQTLIGCGANSAFPGLIETTNKEFVVATLEKDSNATYNSKLLANDLYKQMINSPATLNHIYPLINKFLIKEIYIKDEEFGQQAYDIAMESFEEKKSQMIKEYKTKHKDKWQTEINNFIWKNGVKTIDEYVEYFLINAVIKEDLDKKYALKLTELKDENGEVYKKLTNRQETILKDYALTFEPILVKHILVKTGGTISNPSITLSQAEKISEVFESLDLRDFETTARLFSEDEASSKKDGSLGLMNSSTKFVPEFKMNVYSWLRDRSEIKIPKHQILNTPSKNYALFPNYTTDKAKTFSQWQTKNPSVQDLGSDALKKSTPQQLKDMFLYLFGSARTAKWISYSGSGTAKDKSALVVRSSHGIHIIKPTFMSGPSMVNIANLQFKQKTKAENYEFNSLNIIDEHFKTYFLDFYWKKFVLDEKDNKLKISLGKLDNELIKTKINDWFKIKTKKKQFGQKNALIEEYYKWLETMRDEDWYSGYNKIKGDGDDYELSSNWKPGGAK